MSFDAASPDAATAYYSKNYENRWGEKMISRKNAITYGILVAAVHITGCATITGTEHQSISVQAKEQTGREVSGAACELTNSRGRWTVNTPGLVMVNRSNEDMQVICSKTGLEPGRGSMTSATKGSMFGNIVFGGGVGAIIDHSKGTAYEYPGFIQIVMGAFTKVDAPDLNATTPGPNTTPAPQTFTAPPAALSDATVEERLKEIKRLHDAGLITRDVYNERQRLLLDAKR
jgi:hypothetical protein